MFSIKPHTLAGLKGFLTIRLPLAIAFLFASKSIGLTADNIQSEIPDREHWRVIFSPYVWGASLEGDAGLYGLDADIDVPFKDILKNLDVSFMANVEVTNGLFGAYLDGQHTRTKEQDDIRFELTSTSISGGIYYRLFEQQLEGLTLSGRQRVFAVEPTVGLRWTGIKAKIVVGPYTVSDRVDWVDPFVGTRIFYDINERWNIFAEADVGGFGAGSKVSLNGQVYLGYRTHLLDLNTTWRVGYRALYQDFRDDDPVENFKYSVTKHGPVVGLSVEF